MQKAFTIIELLIVIVIIGILVAITAVSYNGIVAGANEAVVQSDLASLKQQLEIYRIKNGRYPLTEPELTATNIKATKNAYNVGGTTGSYANFYYCISSDEPAKYGFGARAAGSNKSFYISNENSIYTKSSAASGALTCTEAGIVADNRYSPYALSTTGVWSSWVN